MLRLLALLLVCTALFCADDSDQMLFADSLGLVIGTYHDDDHRFVGVRADDATRTTVDVVLSPGDILAREKTWPGSRQAKAYRTLAWQRSLAEAELAGVEKALIAARAPASPPAQWLSKETQERYQRELAWKAEQAATRELEAQKLRKRIADLKEAGAQIDAERKAQLLAQVAAERERRRNAAAPSAIGERDRREEAPAAAPTVVTRADEATATIRQVEPQRPDEPRARVEQDAAALAPPTARAPLPPIEDPAPTEIMTAHPLSIAGSVPAHEERADAPAPSAPTGMRTWIAPLITIAAILIGGALFLIPVAVAYARRHRYALPIAIVCVVFPLVLCGSYAVGAAGDAPGIARGIAGTLGTIAWLASLVWACMPAAASQAAAPKPAAPVLPTRAPAREAVLAVGPEPGGIPLPSTWTSSGGMTREAPVRPPTRSPAAGDTTRIRQPPRPR